MNRIDCEPRVGDQRMQDRIPPGFNRERDRSLAKASAQDLQPAVKGFGGGADRSGLLGRFGLQREGVFFVAPVQCHQGRVFNRVHDASFF